MAGFNSKVVVCQPQGSPLADIINEQGGLYTLFLRGFQDGWTEDQKKTGDLLYQTLPDSAERM